MSDSAFRVRRDITDILPPIVTEPLPDQDDDTANLLIIPISKEIAPDFTLIGYDDTIRRIEDVLTQRGKQRNVMLYGDNGAGKTAITQGLVQRKNRNDLSTHMYKRMFYRLNSSRLLHMDDVAEINKQFDQVLQEFGRYDVLVIENFYTLITYLRIKGANVVLVGLLEALSRRKLQAIITCNTREKALILNEIPEAHEFFAPEKLSEPNNEALLNILRGVHRSYEARYGISITDEAMCSIRDLTQRYRTGLEGWAQPGRALILLDRAIAQFSVRMNSKPAELTALENQAECLKNEIESLTPTNGDIATPHDKEHRNKLVQQLLGIEPQITTMKAAWEKTTKPIRDLQSEKTIFEQKQHTYIVQRRRLQTLRGDTEAMVKQNKDATTISNEISELTRMLNITTVEIRRLDDELAKINLSALRDHTVTDEHVAQTFSELSGISVKQLTENERERVLHMEEILGQRVFGQSEAIKAVATAVRRDKANLTEEDGPPKGSFLFLGPSGVGKTETGKALAEFLTGSEANLLRFDMSEYMEKHQVARMIGAPPGYAGHEEGGTLTNAVQQKPQSVVMFDEIEKAHPDVFKILLQVLSDSRLTDGFGTTVDFKNTYIILTSNAGTGHFLNDSLTFDEAKLLAMKDVEALLLPELRGRIDATIAFQRLGLPMLERVAQRRINAINKKLTATSECKLWIDPAELHRFCEANQDSRYGARSILKAMKSSMENRLAETILASTVTVPGQYNISYDHDEFAVTFVPT